MVISKISFANSDSCESVREKAYKGVGYTQRVSFPKNLPLKKILNAPGKKLLLVCSLTICLKSPDALHIVTY